MKIVAIGAGNLAHHLIPHLYKQGHEILQVGSRSLKTATELSKKVKASPIASMREVTADAEVYIMMVPDNQIKHLSQKLPFTLSKSQIICHCSGSIGSDVISEFTNNGVLYPLQSFSKEVELDYSDIPFFITASNRKTKTALSTLAKTFTTKVKNVTDEERGDLHIAAVLVNNFVNYILGEASYISEKQKVNFKHLHPLIKETIHKALSNNPNDVQTGPAKRNDTRVIKNHVKKLEDNLDLQKVYKTITKAIRNKYK